ncbi:hypothetical protein LQ772_06730 [Frateuria edaphi]|uniref:hypothetical protein n=1 Tax=Frateuria edaphi TaxID=2898793 RepID=UPI001E64F226|nr:hypothetical protein [Frateuria edaphi]UGB46980.1 hypothetical protein LQ772_06730 [Frateuria edaphi]
MNKAIKARLARFWAALWPWIALRLRQPSTYAGLVMKVAGILGFAIESGTLAHVCDAIAVVAGALLIAWDQTAKPDDTDQAGA